MLEQIDKLPDTICNIVEYVNCSSLEYVVKQFIMNRYVISPQYTDDVDNIKVLKENMGIITAVPLQGERWLIVVDVDKIGVSSAASFFEYTINSAIVLYVTHNYRNYMTLLDNKMFKQQNSTNYAVNLYFGKLTDASIECLYNFYLMGKPKRLDKKLMQYLKKNYKYNPDLVCDLFAKLKDGADVKTEKDIIEMVGVGGNTPQALTISLLTTTTQTDRGKKQFLKKNLMLFNDLSIKFSYETTYAYMISTLKGIIDIKELQISGRFFDFYKDIPDTYTEERKKRINRLHRFEYIILNKISLRRALLLLRCMQSKDFNRQQVILQGIYEYVNSLGGASE